MATLLLGRTTLCYRGSGSSFRLMGTTKACEATDKGAVDKETSSGSNICQKQRGKEVLCGDIDNRSKKRLDRDSGDRRQLTTGRSTQPINQQSINCCVIAQGTERVNNAVGRSRKRRGKEERRKEATAFGYSSSYSYFLF
ncbi:uncharacterized protein TrAtP1_007553 [Trichoderma atroviride]|uniref:uncharacterized protein n=1 Tax=Hypocrea atroviridis TaxID=63577 RepID=UPI0033344A5A|nr:hypothetical protein TrAtP1_007553 [Trichoderma atroviride]